MRFLFCRAQLLNSRWVFYKDADMTAPYVNGSNVATILDPGIYRWVSDYHITNDDTSS
jgi:hypothetical protein